MRRTVLLPYTVHRKPSSPPSSIVCPTEHDINKWKPPSLTKIFLISLPLLAAATISDALKKIGWSKITHYTMIGFVFYFDLCVYIL